MISVRPEDGMLVDYGKMPVTFGRLSKHCQRLQADERVRSETDLLVVRHKDRRYVGEVVAFTSR